MSRMFANGPGERSSIPGCVLPKTLKMVLDTSLLNTQQYMVCIKGKVEQSRERSSTLPYTSVAIEKGAVGSPPTSGANFTFTYISILWCNNYRRKWIQLRRFKSWTTLFVFHIVLIPFEKYESKDFPSSLW